MIFVFTVSHGKLTPYFYCVVVAVFPIVDRMADTRRSVQFVELANDDDDDDNDIIGRRPNTSFIREATRRGPINVVLKWRDGSRKDDNDDDDVKCGLL